MVFLIGLGLALSWAPRSTFQNSAQAPAVTSTFDLVKEHKEQKAKRLPSQKVRPGPSSEIMISSEDCEFDYACYCQDAYTYGTRLVEAERAASMESELRDLSLRGMFGCYETDLNQLGQQETKCRSVQLIQLKGDEKRLDRLSLPQSSSLPKVWVEYSSRVDSRGLPLEASSPEVMPILVVGAKARYEVLQTVSPKRHCSMSVHFSGRVFDARKCKVRQKCLQGAHEALNSAIRHEFSRLPFSAEEIHDQPIAPGELWMRRAFKPSALLKPPYFELTTYVFKEWFATYEGGDFALSARSDLSAVYLNLSVSLNRSVGISGEYTEPTALEISEYKSAADAAIAHALEHACDSLHGEVHGSVCVL